MPSSRGPPEASWKGFRFLGSRGGGRWQVAGRAVGMGGPRQAMGKGPKRRQLRTARAGRDEGGDGQISTDGGMQGSVGGGAWQGVQCSRDAPQAAPGSVGSGWRRQKTGLRTLANNGRSDPLRRPARVVTMSVCVPEPGTGGERRSSRPWGRGRSAAGNGRRRVSPSSTTASLGVGQRGALGTGLRRRLQLPWSREAVAMETDVRGPTNQCGAAAPAHLLDGSTRLGGDLWP